MIFDRFDYWCRGLDHRFLSYLFVKVDVELLYLHVYCLRKIVKYEISFLSDWCRNNDWTRKRNNDRNKKQSCLDRANNLRIFHVSRIRVVHTVIRIRYTHVYISESFYFYSLQLLGAKAIRARSQQAQTNPALSRTTNVFVPQLSSEV